MKRKEYFDFLYWNTDRLRIRIDIEKGQIIDLVYQYETLINGNWVPIVRYDLAHGFFHKDIMLPNGEQEKTVIKIENLNSAAEFAEKDIRINWKIYKKHFLNKKR